MNVTMQPTNLNQPMNNKPAFKSKATAVKDAVELMSDVRCSYQGFESGVLKRVIQNMQEKLETILYHQNVTGNKIFIDADVHAVESKINSLKQQLSSSKLNLNAWKIK